MEYLIGAAVIWLLWQLFGKSRKGSTAGRETNETTQVDQEWQRKRRALDGDMAARKEKVLSSLRAGRLKPKQIEAVIESSGRFGFSQRELEEFQQALDSQRRNRHQTSQLKCRVCGRPAMPGEDLCYSHHAK